jgi:ribonuclease D
LVEKRLGIALDKKETRSNWIRRPLTDAQLKYAALDVEYLIHLYEEQKEQLLKSSKLNWLNQDIERLIRNTFSEFSPFNDLERTLTKAQEAEILNKLNNIVEEIAGHEKINTTLFFSKKAQKDFLRLVLAEGLDSACDEITFWRKKLIKEPMSNLLR